MTAIVDRGPSIRMRNKHFEREGVALIVARNAGGGASVAKITAARRLGLTVVMIRRPLEAEPEHACHSVDELMDQLRRLLEPKPIRENQPGR